MRLSRTEALALRMRGLMLEPASVPPAPVSVARVVEWIGALQSQDYASGLWSLGSRLPAMTRVDIVEALERREALRTWPMRGTLHLVPARDAAWMMDLMGSRALAAAAKRRQTLGLDEATAEKAVGVLGDALRGGGRMTRAECVAALEAAGISGGGQRAYHLLWYASQRGVTCLAPNIGSEQTFVRLDEWVPDPNLPDRDAALATMAARYVRSHGPVPRQDLAGWTGMPAAVVRRGLELAGESLVPVDVEGREMWVDAIALDAAAAAPALDPDRVQALPGFDEYLLGFKDRAMMLGPQHTQAVVPGGNGVFQATLVRAGRVVGTWKRSSRTHDTLVSVHPFERLTGADRRAVEAAFEPYARYLDQPVDVRWPD